MKRKQQFEGEVIQVNYPNRALVKVDDEIVHMNNLIVGQKVRGYCNKKKGKKFSGRLLELLEKSPMEIDAPCPVYGECGGCLYQSLSYEDQLKQKEEQVQRLMAPVFDAMDEKPVYEGIVGSPDIFRYRNKMEFSFGDSYIDGPLTLGMHKRGSMYDITDASECYLVHEDFNKIVSFAVKYCEEKGYTYYHKKTHEGFLRYLIIRRGIHTNELMVNFVTTDQIDPDVQGFVDGILGIDLENKVVSILQTINNTVADAVKPEEVRLLHGRDYINETLLDLNFKISPFSFFQTNSKGAEELYKVVREYVGDTKDKVVFDLYSGTGTITQLVADVADKAVGVEIIEEAVEAAKQNAEQNGLTNAEFIAGDVLKVLDDLTDKPDTIILDPPRDGIHPKALPKIIEYGVENIVYVSCKPTSLARDLAVFRENGYEPVKYMLVDMFPHTSHVECVTVLYRVDS